MNRILKLQSALLRVIEEQEGKVEERDQSLDWERVHMASCARLGFLMAEEKGQDPELAACACSVHDFGRILTGKQKGHAEKGYHPVKDFLDKLELFTKEEIEIISLAVKNHSRKSKIGSWIEEIVKDADVVDCYQYGIPFVRDAQQMRYEEYIKRNQPEEEE
ncbi:HD domain-containing protein [Anaerovorax sp. IOR16]|uniref:HD domain-containing protein n=1 Tax=Anaerovorax sp. IOR16 TaxID=2773458 RepID=UPI0019D2C39A|nr:HD domain-containing protein [Anaerovorax sp. IOR16]